MSLFNIITLNSNAYVTFIKKLFDASQIEFLLHALQLRLRGPFDLVIMFEPCSCWIGIVVTPTLLTRPGTKWLLPISSFEEVVPSWQWDQTGHWVLSHIWTACDHNSIWLAQKSFLSDLTYILLLKVTMLKNKVKILLISLLLHIELQNFLDAPRMLTRCKKNNNAVPLRIVYRSQASPKYPFLCSILQRLTITSTPLF